MVVRNLFYLDFQVFFFFFYSVEAVLGFEIESFVFLLKKIELLPVYKSCEYTETNNDRFQQEVEFSTC